MYTFLFLGFIVLLLSFLNKYKNAEYGLLFSFVLIFIFSAIRYNFGNDYQSYLEIFNEINTNINLSISGYSRYEFGWVLLNIFFGKISFEGLIIFTSLINCIFYFLFIKKYVSTNYYLFSIFLFYFDSNIFLIGLSAIRQSIAIIFILISINRIFYKYYLQFLISFFFAINFHFSSLILFPVIVIFHLFNNKISIKHVAIILSFFAATFIFKDELKDHFFAINLLFFENRYGAIDSDNSMSFLNFFAYLVVLFFLFISHNKLDKQFQYFCKLLIFAIIIIPIDFILPLTGRLTFYFFPLTIILFPQILKSMNNSFYKISFTFTVICITTIRVINFFTSDTYSIGFGNYKTIFYH